VCFFTGKAKASVISIPLEDNLSRVVFELFACAKILRKSHIRGAFTTGIKWYFIVVDLNTYDGGAMYWVSEPIEWRWKTKRGPASRECIIEETSDEFDPALIAGILSSWVPESFTKFGGDQWFIQHPIGTDSTMANYTNPSTAISDEYSHRPKLEQDICQFIAEQPANDAGIHVAAIDQAVGGGGDAHRISEALDKLMDDGLVFTTIDDSHFNLSF